MRARSNKANIKLVFISEPQDNPLGIVDTVNEYIVDAKRTRDQFPCSVNRHTLKPSKTPVIEISIEQINRKVTRL